MPTKMGYTYEWPLMATEKIERTSVDPEFVN